MGTMEAMPKRAKEEMEQISVRVPKSLMDDARRVVGGLVTASNTSVVILSLRTLVAAEPALMKAAALDSAKRVPRKG